MGRVGMQALQYMRKVCSHPGLVLDKATAAHRQILASQQLSLPLKDGVQHAPKLGALRELLTQCGIGSQGVRPSCLCPPLPTTTACWRRVSGGPEVAMCDLIERAVQQILASVP